ncbi:uncharacterized protein LOC107275206 isoform X2 [Cephus cinctus]|uniref:Uncharacterized protein LOC107275206 isoform X2 n=1 Tax=Cephus cinctus TaxID=211228 RepID=A0AAJ7CI05_CEPCN|nr:uncharacterized protein LOC107275206 isoform X2 [Cephus cinctus]
MIGRVSRVYCNRVYERKITLFSWKQVYSIPHVSWLKVIYQQYSTTSSYHQAFNFPFQKSMDIFRISDYDCVGFDLDNTLLRYNINNMIPIMPAIKKQLQQHKGLPRDDKSVKPTFKTKRAQNRHHEGMMAVQHIMKSRNQKKSEDEDEDSAVN